jgi:hypothetical protein
VIEREREREREKEIELNFAFNIPVVSIFGCGTTLLSDLQIIVLHK